MDVPVLQGTIDKSSLSFIEALCHFLLCADEVSHQSKVDMSFVTITTFGLYHKEILAEWWLTGRHFTNRWSFQS